MRRTVPLSAEIEQRIDGLLATGMAGEDPQWVLSELVLLKNGLRGAGCWFCPTPAARGGRLTADEVAPPHQTGSLGAGGDTAALVLAAGVNLGPGQRSS